MRGGRKVRMAGKFFFVLYVCFLVYFLIFSDWYGREEMAAYTYNLIPFREIRRFLYNMDAIGVVGVFNNLIGNVVIFIPFGFFVAMSCYRRRLRRCVMFGFLCSFLVELFQIMARVGSFDVDDMILNTFGSAVGYICFILWRFAFSGRDR